MASVPIKKLHAVASHSVICTSRETIVKNCFSSENNGGKIFQLDVKVSIYMGIKVNRIFYLLNSMYVD